MPTDDLTKHPLYPHVRSWRDKDNCALWGLGDRQAVWSKRLRWREDALKHFLSEMTAHEIVALIRQLGAGRSEC